MLLVCGAFKWMLLMFNMTFSGCKGAAERWHLLMPILTISRAVPPGWAPMQRPGSAQTEEKRGGWEPECHRIYQVGTSHHRCAFELEPTTSRESSAVKSGIRAPPPLRTWPLCWSLTHTRLPQCWQLAYTSAHTLPNPLIPPSGNSTPRLINNKYYLCANHPRFH